MYGQRPNTVHHSHDIMLHKCFAPARLQSEHSSLILATNTPTETTVLRKTLAFHSFHISEEISIIRETSGLLDGVCLVAF